MTVTGLRLSTAEIVADYLKGRRPMTTPTPGQFDPSDEHSGFTSSYQDYEFLQRVKSDAAAAKKLAQEKLASEAAAKDARLAELEAHFEKTRHVLDQSIGEASKLVK